MDMGKNKNPVLSDNLKLEHHKVRLENQYKRVTYSTSGSPCIVSLQCIVTCLMEFLPPKTHYKDFYCKFIHSINIKYC